jgi:transcriptional regulator with XRE-family HTH domain
MLIKERREALGMTQVQLAKKARMSQGHVSRLESGEKKALSLALAKRLAEALDVRVEDLA